MNCKYDNSLYTTIPPTVLIADPTVDPVEQSLQDAIDNHNFELSYEEEFIRMFDAIEREQFEELIKHESEGSIQQ